MATTDQITQASVEIEPSPGETTGRPARAPVSRMRRFLMRLLFLSYVLVSIAGWMRLIETILEWRWLVYGGVWPGPLYIAAMGGLWGLAGLLGAVAVWLRRPGMRMAAFGVALFLALTYWTDRLLVVSLNQYGNNLFFAAGLTLLGLLCAGLILRPWDEFRTFFKR